jgi:hypothetical protein
MRSINVDVVKGDSLLDPINPSWEMTAWHFESDSDISDLKKSMTKVISKNKEFVDMHRCYQTLAVGNEPSEHFYLTK